MKSVAIRYSDNFAPTGGTIVAHQKLIDLNGMVWFGKMGSPLSLTSITAIMESSDPIILLIHSGHFDRYWAHVSKIQREQPPLSLIPSYYHDRVDKCGCWFCVQRFEKAPTDVMSKCTVVSSGQPLSIVSRGSLSPFFVIEYKEQ